MQLVPVPQISIGSRLAQPIYGPSGLPLLNIGVALSADYLQMLQTRGTNAVWIEDPDTSDIELPMPLSPAFRAKVTEHMGQVFTGLTERGDSLRESYVAVARRDMEASRFADAVKSAVGGGGLDAIARDMDGMLDELKGQQILTGLNSIKTHDSYTFQHSIDVTIMGLVLARGMNWDRSRLKAFGVGCMLHDIGKLFIAPSLLNKNGKLTSDEYLLMKAHPKAGYDAIKAIAEFVGVLAPLVAYQHHEKQDGTGYPRGLRGTNTLGRNEPGMIHDFGSLAAVADVYDAMTSARPYRAGWTPARAIKMIRDNSGSHFNQQAVAILTASVPPYPVYADVCVRSGKYNGWSGVVSEVSRLDLARPTVRLLYNAAGERLSSPVEVNLRIERDVTLEALPIGSIPGAAIVAQRAT